MKHAIFWVLWSISGLIAAVVCYFFLIGLADGSVSSFNLGLWVIILLVTASAMVGSFWLYQVGHPLAAISPLLVLLLPGLFLAVLNLAFLLSHGRIN